jgi:two-component system cell cycle sensor histidine kinase/response regulator CckA
MSASSKISEPERAAAEAPLRLLIVDDDPDDLDLCLRGLRKSGIPFDAVSALTRDDFNQRLRAQSFDIVLADYRMKDWTGIDALEIVKSVDPSIPVILVSGTLGEEVAVDCIKLGITDYVLKHQLARLPVALRRAREERALREAEVRATQALRESEERYRILVENAPEAIVVLDAETQRFVDCNDNALRLFRVTRGELFHHGPAAFSPPLQPDGGPSEELIAEQIALALQGRKPRFEWTHRNSQGDEIACEIHLVSLPSTTRRLVRGSILDITERTRAEAALRQSEARYRGLVNNATYGIYWVDPQSNLLFVNPALVHMLGYESAEELLAVGNTRALYVDPSARDRILAEYLTNERVESTVEWKRKDGKTITVRVNGRRAQDPLHGNECIEVIVQDVTERMVLEKQLRESQKFEAIGQLAGGIAHDFNNMIGAIMGWADIGADETEPDSRLHRHFEKVRHQAQRAAALTRQLLAFARRQILEPRDMDLNLSVIETLSLLEKVIGSNIEIKANLAPDLAVVRADPTQVDQVLMNLCINARDAMPEGGSLVIDSRNVSFDEKFCAVRPLARPGQYAMLAVSDTGTGMDEATLSRIFEPFFTTKELGKGTGLGLATVYGIVQQHGGFLDVESTVGAGSTFRVYLPVSTAPRTRREKNEDLSELRGGSETILIAEDHEGLRHLALEVLTNLGYRVLVAGDGEQALQEFDSHQGQIQLAILDVMLPKLSGPEVYARLSASKPNLPVIFATGYSTDLAILHQALARGLPVLHKPYMPRALARKVREVLDQRSDVSGAGSTEAVKG